MPNRVRSILDGGLVRHIPWARGSSHSAIIQLYADYVSKHYREPILVFDGYEQSSTKDKMQKSRSKGKKGLSVSFTLDMHLTTSKELFLNEISNKQRFIRSLGETLKANHCHVFHDTADGDLLIVKKAIVSAQTMDTVTTRLKKKVSF